MAPRTASPGRPGLVALAALVGALAVAGIEYVAAVEGRETSLSSSVLLSRDVDVVVAESPVTLGTTTDATVTLTTPSSTPPSEDAAGQQGRPGLADVVKARLGERQSPARTLILLTDNATASLHADHVFGERGAKAIRFTSKRGYGLDPGVLRLAPAVQAATTTSTTTAPPPPQQRPLAVTALQPAEHPSPWSALSGIVSDCLMGFSASCLQRKLLVFVNRLSRMERVNLLGSYVSLVRVTEDAPPPISEHVLEARVVDDEEDAETALEALMQHNVDSFIESHVLRFQLPSWFSSAIGGGDVGTGRDASNAVDVDLEDIVETRQGSGRGSSSSSKGGGGNKKIKKKIKKKQKQQKKQGKNQGKMMKKMMKGMTKMGGMMMFGMLGKTAMLAPMLGFLGTLSLKLSTIALVIAKVMLLRSVFSGGLSLPGLGGGKGGLSSLFSGFGGGGTQQPSSGYGAPAQQPSSGYGTPAQQPSSGFGAPASSPPASFTPPTSSYGAPAPISTPQFMPPSTSYGTPTASYSQPSFRPPSSDYGAPTGGSYFPTGGSSSSAGSSSSSSSFGGGGGSFGGGGASSGASSGSSANSGGFGASAPVSSGGQGGYVGGGANWVNRRGWDAHALAYGAYLQEPEMHTTTEPIL